jgi:hypothetical protein
MHVRKEKKQKKKKKKKVKEKEQMRKSKNMMKKVGDPFVKPTIPGAK